MVLKRRSLLHLDSILVVDGLYMIIYYSNEEFGMHTQYCIQCNYIWDHKFRKTIHTRSGRQIEDLETFLFFYL